MKIELTIYTRKHLLNWLNKGRKTEEKNRRKTLINVLLLPIREIFIILREKT